MDKKYYWKGWIDTVEEITEDSVRVERSGPLGKIGSIQIPKGVFQSDHSQLDLETRKRFKELNDSFLRELRKLGQACQKTSEKTLNLIKAMEELEMLEKNEE